MPPAPNYATIMVVRDSRGTGGPVIGLCPGFPLRRPSFALLVLAFSLSAFGQVYDIRTIAGGGVPENLQATSANLGDQDIALAAGAAGDLFIGLNREAAVLRMDSSGILTRVAGKGTPGFSGDGGPAVSAQLCNPQGLAVDSAGNVYIADWWNHRVREVSGGVIKTVAGSGATGFGGSMPIGCGASRKPAPAGGAGFSGDGGPATAALIGSPIAVAVDASGNLYIATGSRILRVSNGVITIIAGNGTLGFSGDGGPAVDAELRGASGMALAPNGDLYFADDANAVVRKVSNGIIATVAGTGTPGFAGDGGPATGAQLFEPSAVALDAAGNLYISDWGTGVRKVSNGIITTLVGKSYRGSPGLGDGGPAAAAPPFAAGDLVFDSAGALYVADQSNARVRTISNGIVNTVAGGGIAAGDNGPAESAQFDVISNIAVDGAGNIYVADEKDNRVRKISDGVVTAFAGTGAAAFGGDGGPATAAQLNDPLGVAVDSAGNVYIADCGNNRVRKVSNGIITTVVGNGANASGGDGGPATAAPEPGPMAVAVDSHGNLYIVDYASRVREVSNGIITTLVGTLPPYGEAFVASSIALDAAANVYIQDPGGNAVDEIVNGALVTVAGNGTYGFSGDGGPATQAELFCPSGIALNAAGDLYIADLCNVRIRRVSQGMIETVAGNGTGGFAGDGGWAMRAEFSAPAAIVTDAAGNLYVADQGNGRIRKLTPERPRR